MSAPDIFLSYNREDASRAKQFAEAFEGEGFNVWWDVALRSGEAYDKVTEDALKSAKAVVVLWSPRSVESRWCRAEATLADRRKVLMPAMIEPCERPIMFELVQTAELSHWQGASSDPAWQAFAQHVREFVGKAPARASKPSEPLPRLDQVSIVVLPFANMSGGDEQEYFADGMTEDIITDLSQVSALMVIARNTAFTFKGKAVDVADVARQLNVSHVLEGSVRKAGNRVRVTAQLIDGSTGGHLWAQRFDRDLDDIFELQDELSKAIVEALKVKLLPQEKQAIEARATDNTEAYDLFIRGRDKMHRGQFDEAAALLGAALAVDPGLVAAWEVLIVVRIQQSVFNPARSDEFIELSREAAAAAEAINPGSPRTATARVMLSVVGRRDWLVADAAYRELEAGPDAYRLEFPLVGVWLSHVGRMEDAIAHFHACLRRDPMMVHYLFVQPFDCLRRFDEAEAESRRMRKLDSFPQMLEYFTLLREMAKGDVAAIKAQFALALGLEVTPNFPVYSAIAEHLDDKAAIAELLREAGDDPLYDTAPHRVGLAQMAGFCGDVELSLRFLREALVDRHGVTVMTIWHPLFAEARKTDAFKAIVRDLGIYDYWRKSGNWGDFARPKGDDDFEIIA